MVKKFNVFLRDGVRPNKTADDEPPNQQHDKKRKVEEPANYEDSGSALCELKNIGMQPPKNEIDINNVVKIIESAEEKGASHASKATPLVYKSNDGENSSNASDTVATVVETKKNVAGPDPSKPLRPKAKVLRAQRKKEKLLAASASGSVEASKKLLDDSPSKHKKESVEKKLKDFIDETPQDGHHKFKVYTLF